MAGPQHRKQDSGNTSITAKQVTKAAQPTRVLFDPWNSSSTGHQRAENRLAGSTSWRDSRTRKLKEQFKDRTGTGGKRIKDSVGAGSEHFGEDGRTENGGWVRGAPGLRGTGQPSIQESVSTKTTAEIDNSRSPNTDCRPSKRRRLEKSDSTLPPKHVKPPETQQTSQANAQNTHEQGSPTIKTPGSPSVKPSPTPSQNELSQDSQIASSGSTVSADAGFSATPPRNRPDHSKLHEAAMKAKSSYVPLRMTPPKQIFTHLNFYINGSTYPVISDYKLKQLIGQHGGSLSLGLGRRTVTHVILGELSKNGGAGGGLAGSKIQKEAGLGSRSEGVKYVKAAWVVECVRQGKRVSEGPYQVEGLGIGGSRQRSVMSMMNR